MLKLYFHDRVLIRESNENYIMQKFLSIVDFSILSLRATVHFNPILPTVNRTRLEH